MTNRMQQTMQAAMRLIGQGDLHAATRALQQGLQASEMTGAHSGETPRRDAEDVRLRLGRADLDREHRHVEQVGDREVGEERGHLLGAVADQARTQAGGP